MTEDHYMSKETTTPKETRTMFTITEDVTGAASFPATYDTHQEASRAFHAASQRHINKGTAASITYWANGEVVATTETKAVG